MAEKVISSTSPGRRATRERSVASASSSVEWTCPNSNAITFCRERFIDPVVISSGFRELIEPVLAWGGVRLPVVAHSATFSGDGTIVEFLQRPICPVCGEQCKRMDLDRLSGGRQIAYVGDGWSDRCAAKAADVVFARASLAQHLADEGVAYVPFEDMTDVREGLRSYLAPA